jgi:hypothetical protein
VLHNDYEATSLSILLAAAGIRAGQLELQARLSRSGPLDPQVVCAAAQPSAATDEHDTPACSATQRAVSLFRGSVFAGATGRS